MWIPEDGLFSFYDSVDRSVKGELSPQRNLASVNGDKPPKHIGKVSEKSGNE